MIPLEISLSAQDGHIVIAAQGDLDGVSCEALDRGLTEVGDDGCVILDMSAVTFMDSTGLAVLIKHWQRLTVNGGNLTLAGVGYRAARVLWITGLVNRFSLTGTLQQALRQHPPPCTARIDGSALEPTPPDVSAGEPSVPPPA